jgi:hypothetical protein
MTRRDKDLARILDPASDAATSFDVLVVVLQRLGFELRIRGSHHMFSRVGVVEIIDLQKRGSFAKPYQVRQVRRVILKYNLGDHRE